MSAADASALTFWSTLSSIGFVMVVVGVFLEGAELFAMVSVRFKRKHLAIVWSTIPAPRTPRWAHTLDYIGWFILVVGLAIELWGHFRIESITTRENHRLNKELEKAIETAGLANERAALAIERASKAELARVKLEQEIAMSILPRELTFEHEPQLMLKPYSNTVAMIRSFRFDESASTANQIANLLSHAGWTVRPDDGSDIWGARGVIVAMNSKLPLEGDIETHHRVIKRTAEARDALIRALNEGGILTEPFEVSIPRLPLGSVLVVVGMKPHPLAEKRRRETLSRQMDQMYEDMYKNNPEMGVRLRPEWERFKSNSLRHLHE